jgi:pimeloyl-ACP methyl ester carboxylesterase
MKRLLKVVGGVLLLLVVLLALGVRRDRPAAEVERRWFAPPSQFVDVDGLRVHVRDRGHGEAIVLLHGSNSSLFTWEGWAEVLARDHRVVTLDLPGHGLTGPDPRHRYSPAGMAEVVDRVADRLGLGRFTIGGNSMGGGVAWHYALLRPDRVERLILVDSAGYPRDEPRPFAFRLFSMPLVGHLVRHITPHFMVRRTTREVYGDPSRVGEALVDQYEDFTLRAGNREATSERFALSDDGMYTRMSGIRVPTLILWGSRDHWILPRYGDRFHAEIPGSRLVVLDGLGHVPMEEDPARSVQPVLEFLRQPVSARP